jgi:hypothetical protein
MSVRGIEQEDAELVLADPDADFPSDTSNRHCYIRTVGGRLIQVVVESFDHEQVVTAYEKTRNQQ